jgi:hypothetical protein
LFNTKLLFFLFILFKLNEKEDDELEEEDDELEEEDDELEDDELEEEELGKN